MKLVELQGFADDHTKQPKGSLYKVIPANNCKLSYVISEFGGKVNLNCYIDIEVRVFDIYIYILNNALGTIKYNNYVLVEKRVVTLNSSSRNVEEPIMEVVHEQVQLKKEILDKKNCNSVIARWSNKV